MGLDAFGLRPSHQLCYAMLYKKKSAQVMLLLFANITLFFTSLGTDGRMSVAEQVASELPILVPTYRTYAYALFSLFCNRRCDVCRLLSWKYTCMRLIRKEHYLCFNFYFMHAA